MLKQTILATEKVKRETGLSHVFASLNILTPYGQKQLRGMRPFMPGEEARLEEEFERIREIGEIIGRDDRRTGQLKETLMMVKDNTLTVGKYTDATAKKLGGSIAIKKFIRFEKGEGIEKRQDDFAAEVASMVK